MPPCPPPHRKDDRRSDHAPERTPVHGIHPDDRMITMSQLEHAVESADSTPEKPPAISTNSHHRALSTRVSDPVRPGNTIRGVLRAVGHSPARFEGTIHSGYSSPVDSHALGRTGITVSEFIFGAGAIGGIGSSPATRGHGLPLTRDTRA